MGWCQRYSSPPYALGLRAVVRVSIAVGGHHGRVSPARRNRAVSGWEAPTNTGVSVRATIGSTVLVPIATLVMLKESSRTVMPHLPLAIARPPVRIAPLGLLAMLLFVIVTH